MPSDGDQVPPIFISSTSVRIMRESESERPWRAVVLHNDSTARVLEDLDAGSETPQHEYGETNSGTS